MKPREITTATMMVVLALFLPLAPAAADPPAPPAPAPAGAGGVKPAHLGGGMAKVTLNAKEEDVIFDLTNEARIEHCVPVLFRNSGAEEVARGWSTQMAETGKFEHNPNYFAQMPQRNLRGAGENIVVGPRNGEEMFTAWKNSPGHWENILQPTFTDIGIGFATGPYVDVWDSGGSFGWQQNTWGTQNFGTYTHHEGGQFLDVRNGHTFYREVTWIAEKAITTGYSVQGCEEPVFRPSYEVTREAMAAFLYRYATNVQRDASAVNYTAPAQPQFTDVPPTHTFYTEIAWLESQGLAQGWADGTFRPGNHISREAMAAFLYRYAEQPAVTDPVSFADIPPDHSFAYAITWMASTQISEGYGQGASAQFRPRNATSREATAAFLERYDSAT